MTVTAPCPFPYLLLALLPARSQLPKLLSPLTTLCYCIHLFPAPPSSRPSSSPLPLLSLPTTASCSHTCSLLLLARYSPPLLFVPSHCPLLCACCTAAPDQVNRAAIASLQQQLAQAQASFKELLSSVRWEHRHKLEEVQAQLTTAQAALTQTENQKRELERKLQEAMTHKADKKKKVFF